MNQPGAIAQICIDASINDHNFDSSSTAQNIDRGTTSQKVVHHLRRDFARIGTNALGCNSVITSNDIDSFLGNNGRTAPLDRGQSVGDVFEPSEAAGRFREC